MPIEMKIIIKSDEKGVGTQIIAEGPCDELESAHAKFIYQTIISALETQKGFSRKEPDVCNVKNIIKEESGNVH